MEYDAVRNAITVTDTKPVLNEVRRLIALLDVEPEQVIIDVKFVSTKNDDLLTFGVNYAIGSDEGISVTSRPMPPMRVDTPATSPGTTFEAPLTTTGTSQSGKITRLPFGLGREAQTTDQFFLTTYDMLATLRAFKRDRFTKLIQAPTLSVTDNTEATIFVGETISYAETKATTNQQGGLEFSIVEGTAASAGTTSYSRSPRSV
jgi:type II secretory pathway component GspD/PulD (secretin)